MSNWKACKDELPPLDVYVLGYYSGGNHIDRRDDPNRVVVMRVRLGSRELNNQGADYRWNSFGAWMCYAHDISHWCELPSPPNQEECGHG